MVWDWKEESEHDLRQTKRIRYGVGLLLFFMVLAAPFLTPIKQYLSIPNDIVTLNNASSFTLPHLGEAVTVHAEGDSVRAFDTAHFSIQDEGESQLIYEVAGVPIKKVNVSVLDDVQVIPGGQSIGVQLHTLGVLVVGHHLVHDQSETRSPGEEADIKVGDIILEINGQAIKKVEDVKPIVDQAGKTDQSLTMLIKRGQKEITTEIKPIYDTKDKDYRLGLYIRDSAAGIGTLSFYDPVSYHYGALGHVISDMDTQKPIEIHDGTIVRSTVTSIEKGNHGSPGEKQATFSVEENKIGNITKNSPFGIFGKLDKKITNGIYDEPMSIALSHEVKEGPATILTVVEDEVVEEFDVEIVSSVPQKFPATKGMVIKVTDPKLLEKTGGIVQGMSGSPIIQDHKVIGAVTHVFVNDPTSGYGVHIEWMLQEAGIEPRKPLKKAS